MPLPAKIMLSMFDVLCSYNKDTIYMPVAILKIYRVIQEVYTMLPDLIAGIIVMQQVIKTHLIMTFAVFCL